MAKIHVGVYLTDNKNITIELPVNPSDIGYIAESIENAVTITSKGEVNQLSGGTKLVPFEFDFLLPKKPKQANYTTAQSFKFNDDIGFINWITNWRVSNKPGRLVVTDGYINYPVTVSSFKREYVSGDDSMWKCSIKLTRFVDFGVRKYPPKPAHTGTAKPKPQPKRGAQRSKPVGKIGKGSMVTVNGRLYRDSNGSGPGAIEKNVKRKISNVAPGRKYPYHIITLSGGWRGWVSANSVRLS